MEVIRNMLSNQFYNTSKILKNLISYHFHNILKKGKEEQA